MAGKADLVNGIVAEQQGAWPWQLSQSASPGEFPWQVGLAATQGEFPWQLSQGQTTDAAPAGTLERDPFGG